MPKIITNQQIGIYRNNRKNGKTQEKAAAKADISVRRARDIENNMRVLKTSRKPQEKNNQIDKVFESVIVPLLEEDDYQSTVLLEHIQDMYPGEYPDSLLRTLQRRKKEWKECHGKAKDKEVMFTQEHKPGKLAVCDFTHPKNKVKVTIKGKPFKHIIFHLRLAHSGLSYAQVFEGSGESFEKLGQGLNNGLEYLGGVPEALRTDSMSAAFKNLNKKEQEDCTRRYEALVSHYGMIAKRINKGRGHENGSIESPHGHLKEYLRQRIALRGSNDFDSLKEYQAFILKVIEKRNIHRNKSLIAAERAALKPLPSAKALHYTEVSAKVSSSSMIQVKNALYTVPNLLIDETLLVRLYSDKLDCYLGQRHVTTLKRVYGSSHNIARNINPKHLVRWLIRKPQAFRNYAYKEDLLSNDKYKYIWEHIDHSMEERAACKFMTRLLNLGYTYDCEEGLADIVIDRIHKKKNLDIKALENKFMPKKGVIPTVEVLQHTLGSYNELIQQGAKHD